MQRFKSPYQAKTPLSTHAFHHRHFHPRCHLMAATAYRALRSKVFDIWRQTRASATRHDLCNSIHWGALLPDRS